jgi:hypothetical protein
MYRHSLLELDLIHKQEEMEQLELEQALALSLLAEEERLRKARVEAKGGGDGRTVNHGPMFHPLPPPLYPPLSF